MTDLLSKFDICSQIYDNLKTKIKLFHVFNTYSNGRNILFITTEDKVYSYGDNKYGVCGFAHSNAVMVPTEVIELSGKKVKRFHHGKTFVFAMTNEDQIYSWGDNSNGQLARGYGLDGDTYLKPDIIAFHLNVKLAQITCGRDHVLALTTDGRVFGWGGNNYGQVSSLLPSPVNWLNISCLSFPTIQTIYGVYNQSFAITSKGEVYCWGHNYEHMLPVGAEKEAIVAPTLLVTLSNIVSITCSCANTYFLDKNGHLFFCGRHQVNGQIVYQTSPGKVDVGHEIVSLMSNITMHYRDIECCLLANTSDGKQVFKLGGTQVIATDHKNFIDFYAQEFQTTPNTIETVISQANKYSANFDLLFKTLEVIGRGNFGEVHKVRDKTSDNIFAVKVIETKGL